ncbi:SDR family oxidoreductase [Marinirhabdus gelatinilytica]|uniref:NAD(P)-dependent dehydrogenase (Short-subunit alcohol dehydrogenase family) n=1 Tax=Marinirhabdus gelatinilytica TaxID=1703343 RepID=A0A370QA45_9FLAO|nr:SDR family oxidoreductase [Marinirhabdus gelatinilytica]RDK85202.1 NAD(P)-dependent dehydrogenase (short-subunit alcohol dehydrogenase family) [Marinirhabdus gelatinilytica]
MQQKQNNTVLILGGSSGLGLATAHKLASAGYDIVIVHRDRKSNIPKFKTEIKKMEAVGVSVKAFNKDALKEETGTEIISELKDKSISVLIHSIAKGSLKPMDTKAEQLSKPDLDITLHAMATSWWQWTRTLLQHGKFSENVRNIAFTSEGNTKVWPGYGAVSAAKATLEALMRQMAVELAPKGITTNCIQAGTTQTPSFKMIPGSEKLAEMATKRNPFKRLTQPEDVANAVWLLCQEEGKWINGTVLKVDGGESLR